MRKHAFDIPDEYRGGNCFEEAWNNQSDAFLEDGPELFICHGIATGFGPLAGTEYTHGWNEYYDEEMDGVYVIDTSNGNDFHMPQWEYYRLMGIDGGSVHRYDSDAAYQEAARTMVYGPWAPELQWEYRAASKTAGDGDCFVRAVENVIADNGLYLCHGIVHGQGPLEGLVYPHAWNETADGGVIDTGNGNDIDAPREWYYAVGRIDPADVRRYDYRETLEKLVDTGTYGPWDRIFDFECREVAAMRGKRDDVLAKRAKRGTRNYRRSGKRAHRKVAYSLDMPVYEAINEFVLFGEQDSEVERMDRTVTCRELVDRMNNGEDVYDILDVYDSIARQYAFDALSEITGLDYDVFYDAWLHGNKIEASNKRHAQRVGAALSPLLVEEGEFDSEYGREDTYKVGEYTVYAQYKPNGSFYRISGVQPPYGERFVPEVYPRRDGSFEVQTTAYGSLPPGEIMQVIEGYEYALDVVYAIEDLQRELDMRRNASMRDGRFERKQARKIASDGWDEGICSELISVLEKCQELCYEVENARRGAYCREAGDTYESLGAYAYRLGEDLMDAGSYLEDAYGELTADEIDEM